VAVRKRKRRAVKKKHYKIRGYVRYRKIAYSYRSKLEKKVLLSFLKRKEVIKVQLEVAVPYLDSTGRRRYCRPDFLVQTIECTMVIEAKGSHLLSDYLSSDKHKGTILWCQERNFGYRVVTSEGRILKFR